MSSPNNRRPEPDSAPPEEQAIVIHPRLDRVPYEPSADEVLTDASAVDEALAAPPETAPQEPALVGSVPPPAGARAGLARRALSLDALRGFFLLVMTLGFTIQSGLFADWMYHRQFPPPSGQLADVAGITWRDVAYAAFLFTMAAAFPITLGRRIRKGAAEFTIAGATLKRFVMLFLFALLIGHANTYFIGYTQTGRMVAVLGFAVIVLVFLRPPARWSAGAARLLKTGGWIAAAAFLILTPALYDSTFSPARRDEVIANLAFAGLVGSLLWYLTRKRIDLRLGALALVLALHLSASGDGWVNSFWWQSPLPWLFVPSWLSLLAVVIPGTIAGDLVVRWMNAPEPDEPYLRTWSKLHLLTVATIAAAFGPLLVIGLYNRWTPTTTLIALGLCAAAVPLLWRVTTPAERLLRDLFAWGAFWIVLGLFLEPFEGGIKKVPGTLSYFFVIGGLTTMLLVSFSVLVDQLGLNRLMRPFVDVGQNPMLCYVLYTVLLNSIFEMIPAMRGLLRASAGEAMLRSALVLVLVAAIVQWSARRRLFLRA